MRSIWSAVASFISHRFRTAIPAAPDPTAQRERLPSIISTPFFYKVVDAQLSFQRGSDGTVNAVVLHQNGRTMPAPRVMGEEPVAASRKEIHLAPAALQAYKGRYPLVPGFALQVTVDDGQLYVQATAQPRIPVYASAPDEFFYKVVDAQLTFHRVADGSVEAVTLHQNGQHVKGKKE
jgi:hypothetical protein